MIQFRHSHGCDCGDCYQRPGSGHVAPEFVVACPVCALGEAVISYRYDREHDWAGEAGIKEQDCNCLLGNDFAEDALDAYLDRKQASSTTR